MIKILAMDFDNAVRVLPRDGCFIPDNARPTNIQLQTDGILRCFKNHVQDRLIGIRDDCKFHGMIMIQNGNSIVPDFFCGFTQNQSAVPAVFFCFGQSAENKRGDAGMLLQRPERFPDAFFFFQKPGVDMGRRKRKPIFLPMCENGIRPGKITILQIQERFDSINLPVPQGLENCIRVSADILSHAV